MRKSRYLHQATRGEMALAGSGRFTHLLGFTEPSCRETSQRVTANGSSQLPSKVHGVAKPEVEPLSGVEFRRLGQRPATELYCCQAFCRTRVPTMTKDRQITAEVAPEHGGGATIYSTAPPENVRCRIPTDSKRSVTASSRSPSRFSCSTSCGRIMSRDTCRNDFCAVAELRSLPRLFLLRRHHLA